MTQTARWTAPLVAVGIAIASLASTQLARISEAADVPPLAVIAFSTAWMTVYVPFARCCRDAAGAAPTSAELSTPASSARLALDVPLFYALWMLANGCYCYALLFVPPMTAMALMASAPVITPARGFDRRLCTKARGTGRSQKAWRVSGDM